MTRLGVRAFRTIGDLFKLTDNKSIGDLDLSVASAVFDLDGVLKSSLGRFSRYTKTISCTLGANPNSTPMGFFNASVWDDIQSTQGPGIVPLSTDIVILAGMGIFIGTPANFTDAQFVLRDGTFTLPICRWDEVATNGEGLRDGLGGYYGMDWPVDIKTIAKSGWAFRGEVNVTGNVDVTFVADILSGPPALYGSPVV